MPFLHSVASFKGSQRVKYRTKIIRIQMLLVLLYTNVILNNKIKVKEERKKSNIFIKVKGLRLDNSDNSDVCL